MQYGNSSIIETNSEISLANTGNSSTPTQNSYTYSGYLQTYRQ